MLSPLGRSIQSALRGLASATADAGRAADATVDATLRDPTAEAAARRQPGATDRQPGPDLAGAVVATAEAQHRFSLSLQVLRTADRTLQETLRLV